jgi:hypothetical protein
MSIYVNVVRVTPAAFDAIKRDPSQLEGVFFDEDAEIMNRLGIEEGDSAGFDYRIADEMIELEDEDEGEGGGEDGDGGEAGGGDGNTIDRDLGADGRLDYDAGYGPAFTLSPAAVKKAAQQSAVIELDDDVKAVFQAAAERGDHIIGIVS